MLKDKFQFGIGFPLGSHKSTEENPFQFSPLLLEEGWDGVIEKVIKPAYEAGFRYILLHRPFGESDAGDKMDYDSLVDIMESDHPHRELVTFNAITKFLKQVQKEFPGLVLNAYFGTFQDDDFDERFKANSFTAWINRANRSLGAFLNSPITDISFDAANNYAADDPRHCWVRLIRSIKNAQGREAFIEPIARKGSSANYDLPSISLDRLWNNLTQQETEQELLRRSGEISLWWNGHALDNNNYENDMLKWASRFYQLGVFPILDFNQYFRESVVYGDQSPAAIVAGDFNFMVDYIQHNEPNVTPADITDITAVKD